MNYYTPFLGYMPYTATAPANRGIISSILGGLRGTNWSNILSNIQRTLGVVNQAIPMVKQISPIMQNAKTMFKIMNEFKKVDNNQPQENNIKNNNIKTDENKNQNIQSTNNPTFFI